MNDDRRRYRKIFIRLWRNPVFRALVADDKVMTLYLLSGPQTNRVGLFHLSIGAAAEDVGGTIQAVRNLVQRVCEAFVWQFDRLASVIWIPSWWEFNAVKGNIQNFQGALADLHELPATYLLTAFCQNTSHLPEDALPLLRPWALLGQRSGTGRTQEKERRQDKQEQETTSALARRPETTEALYVRFRDAYPASRRTGGAGARRAFESALNGVVPAQRESRLAEMLAALEQHKRSEQWHTEKFIPLMTTWLNQERWNQRLPERGPSVSHSTASVLDALKQDVEYD